MSVSSEDIQQGRFQSYSCRDTLAVLFRYKWSTVFFFLAVVTLVAIWTITMTPVYEVRSTILVKESRAEVPLGPSTSTQAAIEQVTQEDINSEIEILKSRELIAATLTKVGSGGTIGNRLSWPRALSRSLLGAPELSNFEKMVLQVERRLEIDAVPRSNLIELTCNSEDPEWGARFLETLTDLYFEQRIEIFQVPEAVSFFGDEAKAAETRMREAQAALQEFVQETGVSLPLDAHKQTLLNESQEVRIKLAEAGAAARQTEEAVRALEAKLQREPGRLPSSHRDHLAPEIEAIQKSLVTLRLRQDELLQVYGPNSSKARDLAAQIDLAEKQLKAAEARAGEINRTEPNEVYQGLRIQLLGAQAKLDGDRARYASLEAKAKELGQELEDLNSNAFELERLEREFDSAKQAYLLYERKSEEARISDAMDRRKIVNVSIAERPIPPIEPVSPNVILNLALATLFGCAGALGLAFTRNYLDHTFTTGEDLERHLCMSHLVSIPAVKKKDLERK
jgi:uncharacterized protein involved in exopolysaccharide biosynthesis